MRIAAYGAAESSPCAIFATRGWGLSSLRCDQRDAIAPLRRAQRVGALAHGQLAQPPRLIGADRTEHHPAGQRLLADEQQRLPLAQRAVHRGSGARVAAFDGAGRRPFAADHLDHTELARIGGRQRQHRLWRGGQLLGHGLLARTQADGAGRGRGACTQQRRGKPGPDRLPRPPRRGAGRPATRRPACTATSSCWRTPARRPLSPSAAPGWPRPRASAAAAARAGSGTSAAGPG